MANDMSDITDMSKAGDNPAAGESTSADSSKRDVVINKNDPIKPKKSRELGGPKGLEPTRFGDWEKNGRCSDF